MAESEDVWPTWMDSLSESINNLSSVMTELVLMVFGAEANTTSPVTTTENLVDRSLFFLNNVVGTLSFDHFQLQLLKVFSIILISTTVLIYMAWHVYGLRISERFMLPNRDARANSPSTTK